MRCSIFRVVSSIHSGSLWSWAFPHCPQIVIDSCAFETWSMFPLSPHWAQQVAVIARCLGCALLTVFFVSFLSVAVLAPFVCPSLGLSPNSSFVRFLSAPLVIPSLLPLLLFRVILSVDGPGSFCFIVFLQPYSTLQFLCSARYLSRWYRRSYWTDKLCDR